jgi:hypothetical protein
VIHDGAAVAAGLALIDDDVLERQRDAGVDGKEPRGQAAGEKVQVGAVERSGGRDGLDGGQVDGLWPAAVEGDQAAAG